MEGRLLVVVMPLLARTSFVTAPPLPLQPISVQSHGADGDGFHDRSDGGSPSSRLRVSRIVCSVSEITREGTATLNVRNKRKKMKRGTLDISQFQLGILPGKCDHQNSNMRSFRFCSVSLHSLMCLMCCVMCELSLLYIENNHGKNNISTSNEL